MDSKSAIKSKFRVRTPFQRFKTGLVNVSRKVNPLVKAQSGQPLTRNQFDLTDRFTLTNPNWIEINLNQIKPVNQPVYRVNQVDSPSHRRRPPDGDSRGLPAGTADDNFRRWRVDGKRSDGETCGGAYGFVWAPIAAWSVSMASSWREEHDGGLACTAFSTIRKILLIYWTDENKAQSMAGSDDSQLRWTVATSSTWSPHVVLPVTILGGSL